MIKKPRLISICLILNMVLAVFSPQTGFATAVEQPPAKVAFSDKDVERLNKLLDMAIQHDEAYSWIFKKLASRTRNNDSDSAWMLLAAYTFTGPESMKTPAKMNAECWNSLWICPGPWKPGKRFTRTASKLSCSVRSKTLDGAFVAVQLVFLARMIFKDYVFLARLYSPEEEHRLLASPNGDAWEDWKCGQRGHRIGLARLVGEDAVAALEADLREEQNQLDPNKRRESAQTVSPQDVQKENSKPADAVSN